MPARSHLEGLWSVELIGSRGADSIGILVFEPVRISQDGDEEGRVLGGDRHYAHTGTYRVENRRVSGRVRVVRYDVHEDGSPLFEHDRTVLDFHGTLDPGRRRDVLDLHLIDAEREVPDAVALRLVLRTVS